MTYATKTLASRITTLFVAAAVAITGIAATATPAKANDDLLRFLAGAAAVAIIVHGIESNRRTTPQRSAHYYRSSRILPEHCSETYRIRGRNVEVYNARCLERAGLHRLPTRCEQTVRTNRGHRTVYSAQCLINAGYRPEQTRGRDHRHRDWRR